MESNITSRNDNTSEDMNELSCPICFRTSTAEDTNGTGRSNQSGSNLNFAYSSTCGHTFCLPCLQHLLLASSYENRTHRKQQLQEDEQFVTTTQGACPICRAELSYFDLMKVSFMKAEGNKYATLTKSKDHVVLLDQIPIQLLDTKFQSEDDSYCVQFPSDMNDIATQGVTVYTTYFKEFIPTGVLKLTKCTYLAHTKTFKARAKKIATIPDTEFTVWLHFSDNFQVITHGACCKVDKRTFYEEVVGESYPKRRTEEKIFIYPFSESMHTVLCRATTPKTSASVPLIPNTFWGNIYCQQLLIGLASYHFVKKPNSDGIGRDNSAVAYISHDHKLACVWPPLDNGRPMPSRVFFRNINCPDDHTFRGSICWYDDFQTTWNGASRFDYELKFDSAYFCIRAGTVHAVRMNHNASKSAAVYKLSTFGTDQDYINAGIGNFFIQPMISGLLSVAGAPLSLKLEALALLRSRIDLVFEEIKERLQFDGVTASTMSELLYVLRLTSQSTITKLYEYCQQNSSQPVDEITLDEYPIDLNYYFE